jgi:hypothetical protein
MLGFQRKRVMTMSKDELEASLAILDFLIQVFAVLVAVGIVGEVGFGVRHWVLNRRLQALQHSEDQERQTEIARLNKEAGDARRSAGDAIERAAEANKIAEEERLARLKIEERLAPRRLTAEQIQHLQERLRRFSGQPIQISYLVGDVESQAYASEFAAALGSIGWAVGTGLPSMFNFAGIAVRVQDSTDVPEAAEGLAEAIEGLGITVQRTRTPDKTEINGNRPSIRFDLWISKKGGSAVVARSLKPLHVPRMSANASTVRVETMPDQVLVAAAREIADSMRGFESLNQEQLANEWRVDNNPIVPGSYRYVFEAYRARAIQIRDELWRRSGADKAATNALDADTLAGPSPITDAANYLDVLAGKLAALHK